MHQQRKKKKKKKWYTRTCTLYVVIVVVIRYPTVNIISACGCIGNTVGVFLSNIASSPMSSDLLFKFPCNRLCQSMTFIWHADAIVTSIIVTLLLLSREECEFWYIVRVRGSRTQKMMWYYRPTLLKLFLLKIDALTTIV